MVSCLGQGSSLISLPMSLDLAGFVEISDLHQAPHIPSLGTWAPRPHAAEGASYCVTSVAQSGLTLCDSIDCSPPGSSVHGDSPGKNIGVSCRAPLQGIFPTQGSNPCLLHCRQIPYHQATSKAHFVTWSIHKREPLELRPCTFSSHWHWPALSPNFRGWSILLKGTHPRFIPPQGPAPEPPLWSSASSPFASSPKPNKLSKVSSTLNRSKNLLTCSSSALMPYECLFLLSFNPQSSVYSFPCPPLTTATSDNVPKPLTIFYSLPWNPSESHQGNPIIVDIFVPFFLHKKNQKGASLPEFSASPAFSMTPSSTCQWNVSSSHCPSSRGILLQVISPTLMV